MESENDELKKLVEVTVKKLLEGLAEPLDVELIQKGRDYFGEFLIEDKKYELTFESLSDKEKHYLFKFTSDGEYKLINDIKKAFTTIPTIQKTSEDFIVNHEPQLFIFTKIDSSLGRDRFYVEFCTKIHQKYGYSYSKTQVDDTTIYILGKNFTKEEYFNTFNKIKELYS